MPRKKIVAELDYDYYKEMFECNSSEEHEQNIELLLDIIKQYVK